MRPVGDGRRTMNQRNADANRLEQDDVYFIQMALNLEVGH